MANRPIATLNDVLQYLDEAPAPKDRPVSGLALDSRKVAEGGLFLAVPGIHGDGRRFIRSACQQGAAAILAEASGVDQHASSLADSTAPVVLIDGLRDKVGALASRYYTTADEHVKVVGITGTNGKTSCCWFLSQILSALGRPCALLGTLGKGISGAIHPMINTTPDVLSVHQFIASLNAKGCSSLAMEVSSHGLEQGRVDGVQFDVGVFTNLSRDHLDSYASMDEYARAKSLLFSDMPLNHAVINKDDAYGDMMREACPVSLDILTFSKDKLSADVYANRVTLMEDGLSSVIHTPWGRCNISVPLMGRFNLENLLAVITVLGVQGYSLQQLTPFLSSLTTVPGRMQRFGGNGKPLVLVDYAHTPDALHSALSALREHGAKKLVCVFGCGGDRDSGKRPLMASVALSVADSVVLTSDNPRSESPETIIADAMEGVVKGEKNRIVTIVSRANAIAKAVSGAGASDIVLVAGKGHETYQEMNGVRHPFDDAEHVCEALKRWSE